MGGRHGNLPETLTTTVEQQEQVQLNYSLDLSQQTTLTTAQVTSADDNLGGWEYQDPESDDDIEENEDTPKSSHNTCNN